MVEKIISGGQTGADRAALDFALAHGIPHGGWCPRRRLAEDGALEERYELQETPEDDYAQRTEWNVRGTANPACSCRNSGTAAPRTDYCVSLSSGTTFAS